MLTKTLLPRRPLQRLLSEIFSVKGFAVPFKFLGLLLIQLCCDYALFDGGDQGGGGPEAAGRLHFKMLPKPN